MNLAILICACFSKMVQGVSMAQSKYWVRGSPKYFKSTTGFNWRGKQKSWSFLPRVPRLGTETVSDRKKVVLKDFWNEIFISLFSSFYHLLSWEKEHIFELAFSILESSQPLESVVPVSLVFKNYFGHNFAQTITKTRKRYVLWCSCRQLSQLKVLSKLKAYIAVIAKVCDFPPCICSQASTMHTARLTI